MATTIEQGESTDELYHKFSTSWTIENLKHSRGESIKTPTFSPIPNSDFYFEFSYMTSDSNTGLIEAACKLVLFWNSRLLHVPKSTEMDLTITFESQTGKVLRKCEEKSVSIDGKNSLVILNDIEKLYGVYHQRSDIYKCELKSDKPNLESHSPLIMKCNILFYEHLGTPTDFFRDKQVIKNFKIFVDDFGSIYNSSHLSDIKFKIEDQLVPAHKSILAAHSPVFLRMLSSDYLESKTNIIPIVDSTPEVFAFFLKFLYCGEMEDKSWPVVIELYALADKYDVRTLKRECGDLLASFLSIETVCEILKLAYNFNDDDIKMEAKSFAVKHFKELSCSDKWKELVHSHPLVTYEVVLGFVPNSD